MVIIFGTLPVLIAVDFRTIYVSDILGFSEINGRFMSHVSASSSGHGIFLEWSHEPNVSGLKNSTQLQVWHNHGPFESHEIATLIDYRFNRFATGGWQFKAAIGYDIGYLLYVALFVLWIIRRRRRALRGFEVRQTSETNLLDSDGPSEM
jgi:hypothetical protein